MLPKDFNYRDAEYRAEVTGTGRIRIETGEEFESPSPAATAVLDRPSWNGWVFWSVVNPDGSRTGLDAIRKTAIEKGAINDA